MAKAKQWNGDGNEDDVSGDRLPARGQTMSRRNILARKTCEWTAFCLVFLIPALFWTPEAFSAAGAPTMEDVRVEAVRGGYQLIDLGELRGMLKRGPGRILLVDTRQDWEYRTGHIPGSINFSFEPTRWSRLKNRWALKAALGADKSRPLVFY